MNYLEQLEIPRNQPGYLSKADVAAILAEKYNIKYSNVKIKKMRREDLVKEFKEAYAANEAIKQSSSVKSKFKKFVDKFMSLFQI